MTGGTGGETWRYKARFRSTSLRCSPRGAFAAGTFEPVRDFEASKGGRFVQSKDKQTGQPLWAVDVIDADPQARDKTARVKIAAADQPVLPSAHAGNAIRPRGIRGADGDPYVNQAGRLAYSLKATGVRTPGRAGRSADGKDAEA